MMCVLHVIFCQKSRQVLLVSGMHCTARTRAFATLACRHLPPACGWYGKCCRHLLPSAHACELHRNTTVLHGLLNGCCYIDTPDETEK